MSSGFTMLTIVTIVLCVKSSVPAVAIIQPLNALCLFRNFIPAPAFIPNPSSCDADGNPVIPPVPEKGGTIQGLQQFNIGWVIATMNVASIFSIAFFNYCEL